MEEAAHDGSHEYRKRAPMGLLGVRSSVEKTWAPIGWALISLGPLLVGPHGRPSFFLIFSGRSWLLGPSLVGPGSSLAPAIPCG